MKMTAGVLVMVLFVSTAASAGRPDADALGRFDRTGETVNCVSMRSTDITPINETQLLFKVGVNDYYLNETRGACNDVDSRFTRLEVNVFGNQICSGEILKVVDQSSGIFQGACSLGSFEKLTLKAAE